MNKKTVTTVVLGLFLGGLSGCGSAPEVLDPDGRAYAILHLSFDS
tara:strand:- start:1088 stop:1222 length:135 start_codon:yes stop_codon:yes gene_type:complete